MKQQFLKTPGFRLFLLHLSCFLLVVLYVNMFQFWAWLSSRLGHGLLTRYLPVLVMLVVIAAVILRFVQRVNRGRQVKLLFLGLGIVGAFFSLAIPEPQIPIKRIHVAEYIILAFAVRYTLSYRLSGAGLTFFTVLVTGMFGVHDEMLQGLHQHRFYGWRDVVVNAAAGLSGSLLGHGLLSFEKPEDRKRNRDTRVIIPPGIIAVYSFLITAVALHVFFLYQLRGDHFSYLSLLPLAGMCLVIAMLYPRTLVDSQRHHGLQAVYWLALGLLVYPLAANGFGIEFM
ncbi:MAG: VanZ family protein [Desulfobulbaceae bacterium]|nr:VanZ family protein [Desulfobulbaceae bacterium]